MKFEKNILGEYELRIKNLRFICDELPEDAEALARRLADRYFGGGYMELVQFLLDVGIAECYEDFDEKKLKFSLGDPLIDIVNQTITYMDSTLDDDSIITITYTGEMAEFLRFSIDG